MSNAAPGRSSTPAELERLLFRRQFFLGADYLDAFPTWNRREVAGKRLSAHPDLPVTHVERGRKSMTLLGYALDPDDPTANDAKILDGLLASFDKSRDLPKLTSRLGGRWVLVAHDGEEAVLFHDAAGLRQVYYFQAVGPGGAAVVCASQPALLAEAFGLSADPAAVEYVRSRGDSDCEVYWMPGDSSQYKEVRALLPNHLLSLQEGKPARYWPPAGRLPSVTYAEGLRETVRLLRGLIASARHRYPLAIAMTAGWDSRLMLALSRGAAKDLYCYTLTYPSSTEDSRDVYVPARLLKKLGLSHHVLRYPEVVDASFKSVARRSSSSVHSAYCADAQVLLDEYPTERLCVTGDVAEVVKVHYRLPRPTGSSVSAVELGAVSKVGSHPFALATFESWLAGVAPHERDHIDLLDLFCWEQMAGRWHGQIRAEYDVVQESFAPLGCRSLLVTMLAIDESHRAGPRFLLFREVIEALWADVLTVPINPPENVHWRRAVVRTLNRLHVYRLIPPRAKELARRVVRRFR